MRPAGWKAINFVLVNNNKIRLNYRGGERDGPFLPMKYKAIAPQWDLEKKRKENKTNSCMAYFCCCVTAGRSDSYQYPKGVVRCVWVVIPINFERHSLLESSIVGRRSNRGQTGGTQQSSLFFVACYKRFSQQQPAKCRTGADEAAASTCRCYLWNAGGVIDD